MSRKARTPNLVFISYSHKDRRFLDPLKAVLKPLERTGILACWDDSRIGPGSEWRTEISKALDDAIVAILLVSADFLASDFITRNELPPLLKAAQKRRVPILPVIVRPCRFTDTPTLSQFQAVNDPLNPLSKLPGWKRDQIWAGLAKHVESFLAGGRSESSSDAAGIAVVPDVEQNESRPDGDIPCPGLKDMKTLRDAMEEIKRNALVLYPAILRGVETEATEIFAAIRGNTYDKIRPYLNVLTNGGVFTHDFSPPEPGAVAHRLNIHVMNMDVLRQLILATEGTQAVGR